MPLSPPQGLEMGTGPEVHEHREDGGQRSMMDGGGETTQESGSGWGKKRIVPNRSQRGVLIFDSWMMLRGRPFPTSSRDCLGLRRLNAVMSPGTITSVDSHGPLTGTGPPSNTKLFPKRYSVQLVQTKKKRFSSTCQGGKI